MTDHAHELRRYARKIGHHAGDVPAVMLAAADEIERLQSVIAGQHTMSRDDIIKLAREAGDDVEHTLPSDLDFLERFTAFVAAVEREKCAAKMDAIAHQCRMENSDCEPFVWAAAAIRARGEPDAP